MMVNRLPEKASISENSKFEELDHFNEQGISSIDIRVVSNLDAFSKCCKRMEQSLPLVIEFTGR